MAVTGCRLTKAAELACNGIATRWSPSRPIRMIASSTLPRPMMSKVSVMVAIEPPGWSGSSVPWVSWNVASPAVTTIGTSSVASSVPAFVSWTWTVRVPPFASRLAVAFATLTTTPSIQAVVPRR